ncbi:uncharacterized protein ACN2A1_015309 isoform 1-T6 [Glossina fuscipes fuscipes]
MDGRHHDSEKEEFRRATMQAIGKQNNERSLMNFVRAIFGVSNELVMDKPNHEEIFSALSEAKRLETLKGKEVKPEKTDKSEPELDKGKKMLTKGALRRQRIRDNLAKRKQKFSQLN